MNYVLQGTARHLEPRREEPLKRPEAIGLRPEAGRSPISTRARDARSRIVAALSRRRIGGPPHSGSRQSSGSGASPLATGTSRGIAFLISR